MTRRWPWAAMVFSLLAAPAYGQGQTLVISDTEGWSLDLLRPKYQEPSVLIMRGPPDAEFRARSARIFQEWIDDWPRERLVRQLTDASLKEAQATLLTAEASLATATADYWETWTAMLDDFRRYIDVRRLIRFIPPGRPIAAPPGVR